MVRTILSPIEDAICEGLAKKSENLVTNHIIDMFPYQILRDTRLFSLFWSSAPNMLNREASTGRCGVYFNLITGSTWGGMIRSTLLPGLTIDVVSVIFTHFLQIL